MNTNSATLDRLRIAAPCPFSWDQMEGDDRVRFCGHCRLNVFNISELSRNEAEALIASAEGGLCARLYRRADGSILTKDCPVGLRALRQRMTRRAAAVVAAVVSIGSAAFGQRPAKQTPGESCTPQISITHTKFQSAQDAVLSARILDPAGAAIPKAKVQITNNRTRQIQTSSSNDDGRFQFQSLAEGEYSLKIDASGFKSHKLTTVVIEKNKVTRIELILEFDGATATMGVIADDSLIDTRPGTFIINGDLLRRLPIN